MQNAFQKILTSMMTFIVLFSVNKVQKIELYHIYNYDMEK